MSLSDDLLSAVRKRVSEKRRSAASIVPGSELERELEMYFFDLKKLEEEEGTSSTSSKEGDCFSFWKNRAEKLPKMYNVALDILSVPATSAPVERVFSRAS